MSERQKTTVYLDAEAHRELKRLARTQGRATASLIREAVLEYVSSHGTRGRPRSIGAFSSERGDIAERAEDLLAGMGQPR